MNRDVWDATVWGDPDEAVDFVEQEISQRFNPFDEMGLLVALERLKGEKNLNYRNRLIDVAAHKPSASLIGLLNSISREIGYKPYYGAVTFKAGTVNSASGEELADDSGFIEVSQTGLYYDSNSLMTEEMLYVDPTEMDLELEEYPRYVDDVHIITETGQLPREEYEVDLVNKTVTILVDDYNETWVKIQYHYREYFPFYNGPNDLVTLAELRDSLDAFLTATGGYKYVDMTINDAAAESSPAANMASFRPLELDRDGFTIDVYKLRILEIFDPLLKAIFINSYGHYYDTQVEGWAREIAAFASITWGNCVLDRDQWDIASGNRYLDVLDHLFDNLCARFYSVNPSTTTEYSYKEYVFYGARTKDGLERVQRRGALEDQFYSGMGHGSHLKVVDVVEE